MALIGKNVGYKVTLWIIGRKCRFTVMEIIRLQRRSSYKKCGTPPFRRNLVTELTDIS